MALTLKTTGIATNCIWCVLVDGTTIVDLVTANTITLDTGVAASVATGSWKSIPSPKYFVTTANGTFNYNGVRWAVTRPTVDQTDADGFSVFTALHGASNVSNSATFVEIGSADGLVNGVKRVSGADAKCLFQPGGGTQATTTTNVPTDGTTKFSMGFNYESASDSEAFYGLESGSLASEATAGSDGGFGGVRTAWGIGGSAGQGNQPQSAYIHCGFNRKLTLTEMQSLHDDWLSVMADGGGGGSPNAVAWLRA
jgi:hypothetical protein